MKWILSIFIFFNFSCLKVGAAEDEGKSYLLRKPGASFIDDKGVVHTLEQDTGSGYALATDGIRYKVSQYEVTNVGPIKPNINVLNAQNRMQTVLHVFEKGTIVDSSGNTYVPRVHEVENYHKHLRNGYTLTEGGKMRKIQHLFINGTAVDENKEAFRPMVNEVLFQGKNRSGAVVLDDANKVRTVTRVFNDGRVADENGNVFKPTAHAVGGGTFIKDVRGVARETAYIFDNGMSVDSSGNSFKAGAETVIFAKNFGYSAVTNGLFSELSFSLAGLRNVFALPRILQIAKIAGPESLAWSALYKVGTPGTANATTLSGSYMSPQGIIKFMKLSPEKQTEILALDATEGGPFEKYKNEYLQGLWESASFDITSCKDGNAEIAVTDQQGYKIKANLIKRDDGTTDLVTKNPLNGDIFTISTRSNSFEQAVYNRPQNILRMKGEKKTFTDVESMMTDLSSQSAVGAFQRANIRMIVAMSMQLKGLQKNCQAIGALRGLLVESLPANNQEPREGAH